MKILDTSVIVAFYKELDEPTMLHNFNKLGYELYIPNCVFHELLKGESCSSKIEYYVTNGTIKVLDDMPKDEIDKFRRKHPYLGLGEIEVMLCYIKYKLNKIKCYCILDDKRARKTAEKYGIVFTGTIGLINMLFEKEVISNKEKDKLLKKLINSTFRIKIE